jgi:hypothetical protein
LLDRSTQELRLVRQPHTALTRSAGDGINAGLYGSAQGRLGGGTSGSNPLCSTGESCKPDHPEAVFPRLPEIGGRVTHRSVGAV